MRICITGCCLKFGNDGFTFRGAAKICGIPGFFLGEDNDLFRVLRYTNTEILI